MMFVLLSRLESDRAILETCRIVIPWVSDVPRRLKGRWEYGLLRGMASFFTPAFFPVR
jgi:hypothetical protein